MMTTSISNRMVTLIACLVASSVATATPAILKDETEFVTVAFTSPVTLTHTLTPYNQGLLTAGTVGADLILAIGVVTTSAEYAAISFVTNGNQTVNPSQCDHAVISGQNNPQDNKLKVYLNQSRLSVCHPFLNENRYVLNPKNQGTYTYVINKSGADPVSADVYQIAVNAAAFVY
ncbi:hypothetical protein [Aeromonas salmonicida]